LREVPRRERCSYPIAEQNQNLDDTEDDGYVGYENRRMTSTSMMERGNSLADNLAGALCQAAVW